MPNKGFSVPPLELVYGDDIDSSHNTRTDVSGDVSTDVLTTTRTLYFKVPDGVSPRAYNAADVFFHEQFPRAGTLMDDDVRMVYTGQARIGHLSDDSRYIPVELTYESVYTPAMGGDGRERNQSVDRHGRKIDKDTKPWDLLPSEIRYDSESAEIAWNVAYDEKGRLFDEKYGFPTNPIVNSAGDPLKMMGKYYSGRLSFSFYVQYGRWNPLKASHYEHTVNLYDTSVCGYLFYAGTAMVERITSTRLVNYNKGGKIKYRYWKIDVVIRHDPARFTFSKCILDIGDRANFPAFLPGMLIEEYTDTNPSPKEGIREAAIRYWQFERNNFTEDFFYKEALFSRHSGPWRDYIIPSSIAPQQIVSFHPYINIGSYAKPNVVPDNKRTIYCGWQQFVTYRETVIKVAEYLIENNLYPELQMPDPQCEQQHDIPLTPYGFVNFTAIQTGRYPYKRFPLYPLQDWRPLGLPNID